MKVTDWFPRIQGKPRYQSSTVWCCYNEIKIITIDRQPISPPHGWGMGPNRSWWRHQTEIFSALLAFCAGNSPVNGEFPAQRPVTQSFDLFFDLHTNKWLSKQWKRWWFEMPFCSLWHYCNGCSTSLHCSIQWHVIFVYYSIHVYL